MYKSIIKQKNEKGEHKKLSALPKATKLVNIAVQRLHSGSSWLYGRNSVGNYISRSLK